MEEQKKPRRIAAGSVVMIEYTEPQPCRRVMAILLSPVKGVGTEDLRTVFAIDLDTHHFAPAGKWPGGGKANVELIKDRKAKAIYFQRVNQLLDEDKEKED